MRRLVAFVAAAAASIVLIGPNAVSAPATPQAGDRPFEVACPAGMTADAAGRCRRECLPGQSCPGGGGELRPPNCGSRDCTAAEQCYTLAAGKICDAPGKVVCGGRLCAEGERCIGGGSGNRPAGRCAAVAVPARLCGRSFCGAGTTCMKAEIGSGQKCMPPGSTPCGLTICTPSQTCVRDGAIRLAHCEG